MEINAIEDIKESGIDKIAESDKKDDRKKQLPYTASMFVEDVLIFTLSATVTYLVLQYVLDRVTASLL